MTDADLVARLRLRAGFDPRHPENVRLYGNVDAKLHCESADAIAAVQAELDDERLIGKQLHVNQMELAAQLAEAQAECDQLRAVVRASADDLTALRRRFGEIHD